ncbi:hypothetical protein ILUMI_24297 [Ignelater luminosus]|uniref:FAM193 C-terminal domain-containing protein n=1 Tax=Ignelater luminosus TaxID=2038154 RepID=A0A8K0FWM2_IGNLU|nr:hypothetical protein ILUMI_24297 [Ignelater luminosus]
MFLIFADLKKNKKKGKNSDTAPGKEAEKKCNSNLIEETIPAMVTIKRVSEGSNSPATVTITLKGSTPESDKLLFTLVNGHNNKEQLATATINTDKVNKSKADSTIKIQSQPSGNKQENDSQKNSKKKKKKETSEIASKELKVTIAVDKNNVGKKAAASKKNGKANETPKVPDLKVSKNSKETDKTSQSKSSINNSPKEDINLPMLRLPPGITITKIEGPPANRNCKASSNSNTSTASTPNSNVPVSKSGVIVVDTEKLIQQSITANNNKKNKKKNKKKRDQKVSTSESDRTSAEKGISSSSGSSMVTLKNPIFHTLQTALSNKVVENSDLPVFPNNQQASIFKNENGMVTIRSPRLQNSYENGSPISNFLSDLKPMFGPEVSTPYVPMCHSNFSESSKSSSFNAQEILSGLPGIEITKVDKSISKSEPENKKASQPAEVSIIPTSNGANGADKFNFDRDDWPFESVFTPRDVLEEDMDAEERELEAFKRFCQQSVPPERKEKVAHLNVKDIILNKKRDVTYS